MKKLLLSVFIVFTFASAVSAEVWTCQFGKKEDPNYFIFAKSDGAYHSLGQDFTTGYKFVILAETGFDIHLVTLLSESPIYFGAETAVLILKKKDGLMEPDFNEKSLGYSMVVSNRHGLRFKSMGKCKVTESP